MKIDFKNKKLAYFISIFCMFLWGSAFPTIKTTYKIMGIHSNDYFSMIFVAGIRFLIAGLIILLIMYFIDRKNIRQLKTEFPYLLKLSILVVSLGYFLFYIGTGNTTGMQASIISSSSTFLVIILAHFLLPNERFNKYKLIAIFLGLLGIILSNINKEFTFTFSLIGEGFLVISAFTMALGTILVKKNTKNISAFAKSCGQFLYGAIPLILIGYFGMEHSLNYTIEAFLLIFYGGIISSVAFTLWYLILREYKASEISFIRLFIPFFGTFLSAVLLKEQVNIWIIFGLLLVIIGIYIINRYSNKENWDKKLWSLKI